MNLEFQFRFSTKISIFDQNFFDKYFNFSIFLDSTTSDSIRGNRCGRTVFDVSPPIGVIPADGEKDIKVSFIADHEGAFEDVLRIRFFQSSTDFATGNEILENLNFDL